MKFFRAESSMRFYLFSIESRVMIFLLEVKQGYS